MFSGRVRWLIGIIVSVLLAVGGWIYSVSSRSDGPTINAPSNKGGIVTQGQSGNNYNYIVTTPSPPTAPCRDLVNATYTFFPSGHGPNTTIFTPLSNDDLKKRANTIAAQLRKFAADYHTKITDQLNGAQNKDFAIQKADLDQLERQVTLEFQTKILPQTREAHFELLNRLNLPWPVCSTSGLSVEGYRAIAQGILGTDDTGPTNIANYLETLASRL